MPINNHLTLGEKGFKSNYGAVVWLESESPTPKLGITNPSVSTYKTSEAA